MLIWKPWNSNTENIFGNNDTIIETDTAETEIITIIDTAKAEINKPKYPIIENGVTWSDEKHGTFIDERDNHKYKVVKIGEQVWMAENLAYRISSLKAIIENNKENYWAYNNDTSNVEKYGYLYNWEAAKNLCPNGWHLPNDKEWEQLAEYYNKDGILQKENDGDWQNIGMFLKAKAGWNENGNGTSNSLFEALPGGSCGTDGRSNFEGYTGNWWSSSSESDLGAWCRSLSCNNNTLYRGGIINLRGFLSGV